VATSKTTELRGLGHSLGGLVRDTLHSATTRVLSAWAQPSRRDI
jgi:hypothetical protein